MNLRKKYLSHSTQSVYWFLLHELRVHLLRGMHFCLFYFCCIAWPDIVSSYSLRYINSENRQSVFCFFTFVAQFIHQYWDKFPSWDWNLSICVYQTIHDIITVPTICFQCSRYCFCRVLKGQEQFEGCYAEPWVDGYYVWLPTIWNHLYHSSGNQHGHDHK